MMRLLLTYFDELQSPDFEPGGDLLWKESAGTYLPEQDPEKLWRDKIIACIM
jgi:hypothetical protein